MPDAERQHAGSDEVHKESISIFLQLVFQAVHDFSVRGNWTIVRYKPRLYMCFYGTVEDLSPLFFLPLSHKVYISPGSSQCVPLAAL